MTLLTKILAALLLTSRVRGESPALSVPGCGFTVAQCCAAQGSRGSLPIKCLPFGEGTGWEYKVCDGSGGVVDGRDGSMSVCELPELTRGFNTDITQIQERDKTCADLTPEEWSAEAPIDESISGGLIIGSFPSNIYDYPVIGAYKWNEDKSTTRCVVDPARPDAPTEFIPVMVWGGAQDGFPWEPFKYTHYLGPDSDPDTAGPQGVCVDFTTWGAGFLSEFGTNYSSGRIVFTLPGNWSDVGCGAPTTPPTPSGEDCSDGARAAATVGGLALLLQVIVLIVN